MTTWFDDIGFAYAKRHDEVEAARSAFTSQRRLILDRLIAHCSKGLAADGFESEPGKAEGGWETIWVTRTHAKARRDLANKTKHQSGVCFGLDRDPYFLEDGGGCFGFGAYLFFAMGDGTYAKIKKTLATSNLPMDFVDERGSRGAFIRTVWIPPGDDRFNLGSFEQAVIALPKLFAHWDDLAGKAYTKIKGG